MLEEREFEQTEEIEKHMETGDRRLLPEGTKFIPIYIMGKKYMVPETLTIMKAIEWAGYQFIRGAGCRAGVCGACATVYRLPGDYKLRTGLACQTVIQPGMYLVQIPFVPAEKKVYDLEELSPSIKWVQKYYPETFRCVSCNTCTKACPMDLKVMDYIQAIIRGDFETAAELSHSCIMCGLCAMRCPAEIQHFNVSIMVRRIYGRHMVPKSKYLQKRVKQIKEGKFDWMMDELIDLYHNNLDELKRRYENREWEPEPYENPNWYPKETKYLILDDED